MTETLQDFLSAGVFAFMLTFVRFGTAIMIMPGLGDAFLPANIRLMIALAISFAVFPILMVHMPAQVPQTTPLFGLVFMEFAVGLLIGTMGRILMTAMDTAGMVISFSSGLSNAQLFNPSLAAQGSLIGAFLTVTAMVVVFSLNLHHLLLMGLMESYSLFPVGAIPDAGSMAEIITRTVAASFNIGVKIAAPFIMITILLYVGMGVLTRLMPQIQVFMLALPLQILLSIITLFLIMGAAFAYWASEFEQIMVFFLSAAQSGPPSPQ
jgi:flagellar biosynthetic protein FliR